MTAGLLLCTLLAQAPTPAANAPAAAAADKPAAGQAKVDAAEAGAIRAVIRGGPEAGLHPGEAAAPAPTAPRGSNDVTAVVTEDPNDPAYLIGKEIRCPVCQGMSVADSPSEMAQDMMKQVRVMYKEGKTKEEIFAHFTSAYGDWVLLKPKASGVSWLVWILPPLGLLLAILGIRSYIRSPEKDSAPQPETTTDDTEGDDYLKLVRNEVER